MNNTQYPFLVYISCATYNHVHYVEDALNGFCMQQTDFPFLAMVMDDASTDGEQEVINRYLEQNFDLSDLSIESETNSDIRDHAWRCETEEGVYTFAQHKENKSCYVLSVNLKKNLYKSGKKGTLVKPWREMTKYIALCEGDDYWTDPLKLQKQVEILDSIPNCSLCYHACKNIYEDGFVGWNRDFGTDVKSSYTFKEIVYRYNFQTATVMFRKELISTDLYRGLTSVGFSFGDALLYMTAAHFGDVLGLTEEMSVYRRVNNGISVAIHKGETRVKDTRAYINTLELFGKNEKKYIYKGKIRPNMFKILMDDSISFGTYISLIFSLFMAMPYYGLYLAASHLKFKALSVFKKE